MQPHYSGMSGCRLNWKVGVIHHYALVVDRELLPEAVDFQSDKESLEVLADRLPVFGTLKRLTINS